jgi:hypothetical protein
MAWHPHDDTNRVVPLFAYVMHVYAIDEQNRVLLRIICVYLTPAPSLFADVEGLLPVDV